VCAPHEPNQLRIIPGTPSLSAATAAAMPDFDMSLISLFCRELKGGIGKRKICFESSGLAVDGGAAVTATEVLK